ncbi:adenosylhomocysteine nucleosidase [Marininema mesophilum]|uniref:adenosylhomocysteine nucleosidase n=1 Tax=Marininema mesophilum TaxID=1048340 RepID=A0A1H2Q6B3_9BACL|nr:5'-methylthioadenosine/adenosylhomocysteine nucleosidase [Marininema mesophilum]SDW02747.1 adenosylhomocysteine nucleosidase [Marininema mesophilum]
MKSISCAVIAAMHEELAPLKKRLQVEKEEQVGGIHLTHALVGEERIILAVCGIGKANAGAAIQYLITAYSPEEIINIGSAGALTNRFPIGATVLVTESIYHDVDCTGVGEDPYTLPRVPSIIPSDTGLITRLREAATQKGLIVAEGRIATGDSFISDGELRARIHEGTMADCAEMETAAFAQIAYLNDVPFASIRSVSDRADGSADVSFDTFLREISERNAELLESYLHTRIPSSVVL